MRVREIRSFSGQQYMEIYSLQGVRLSSVPTNGVYIIRKGGKVRKMFGK